MNRPIAASTASKALIAAAAALGLAACSPSQPDNYETDVTDKSGGELIVDDATSGVDVTLPETPMTNVPPDTAASGSPETGTPPTPEPE